MKGLDKKYLEEIKGRKTDSRVYSAHQLLGLKLAELLDDKKHVSLYMKLAREQDSQRLLSFAKDVSEREGIRNKGAYFMRLVQKKQ